MQITRRGAILLAGAGTALARADSQKFDTAVVVRHDKLVEKYLSAQITATNHAGRGTLASLNAQQQDIGIYAARPASSVIEACTAAYLCKQSHFWESDLLIERIKLAAAFLARIQHQDGLVDYLDTNFDSAPDTGFTVWGVATAACLAKKHGQAEILSLLKPFLQNAGRGMVTGGVHTPNHRWVICSALAQIHDLFPDASYVKRIDQWLGEGIDIDGDGQFTERSTSLYNTVCDRSLLMTALKLNRSELLVPVRKNLEAMLYLLHADFSVVTEVSRRQDRNVRADMTAYWFPLQYFAVKDQNGQFAFLAQQVADKGATLPALMEFPELAGFAPVSVMPPDRYVKEMNDLGIVRFRNGKQSSTLLSRDPSFLVVRNGFAVIRSIRFASAFFGKGQFEAEQIERRNNRYVLKQQLEAGYYQPLDGKVQVTTDNWGKLRSARRETQRCFLQQSVEVQASENGFEVHFSAAGTTGVPVAIEINLGSDGDLQGCERLGPDTSLLTGGYATLTTSDSVIRIGPGVGQHRWITIRGALPRSESRSIYLTAFTPFHHTLQIELTAARA